MKEKIKKLGTGSVFLLSVLCFSAMFFAGGIVKYVKISSLQEQTLQFENFTLNSMKPLDDGAWACTDSDPQIIIEIGENAGILRFEMDSELYTGDIAVYYTESDNADFTPKKILWAKEVSDNIYKIDFGGKYIQKIRIDPTVYGGDRIVFGDFVINFPPSAADCFLPDFYDIFVISVCSVTVCAAFGIVKKFF